MTDETIACCHCLDTIAVVSCNELPDSIELGVPIGWVAEVAKGRLGFQVDYMCPACVQLLHGKNDS